MNETISHTTALLIIDVQNDYFPGGLYPLSQAGAVLDKIEHCAESAIARTMPVILVQHIAQSKQAPFFRAGTAGAEIHPRLRAVLPEAPVVIKAYADSFYQTDLAGHLDAMNIRTLLICGMMTQNCVTHTALSRAAEKYQVIILQDCCGTVDEMLHKIALNALSIRVELADSTELESLAALHRTGCAPIFAPSP